MNTHFDDRDGDPLADLLGSATTGQPRVSTAPASYTAPTFEENCKKCGGSGRFRNFGRCFTCNGSGKRSFKTSPDKRASSRASSAKSKAAKIAGFKVEYPDVWAWMDGSTFPPAIEMVTKLNTYGSLLDSSIEFARRMIAKRNAVAAEKAARAAAAPTADTAGVDRLKAAFDAAIAYTAAKGRGMRLKTPRITIGAMTIAPAKATSTNPGALYVKTDGDFYLGKVTGGRFFASRECSAEQEAKVLAFIADPQAAAEAYGQEVGTCCICSRELRSEWRLRGIGPVCAEKMGW